MSRPAHLLEAIEARLATAREGAASGAIPSLEGLEEEVRSLAAELVALSPAESLDLKPRLAALLAEFEALSEHLKTVLAEIAAAIREDRVRQAARGAYQRAPTTARPGGD